MYKNQIMNYGILEKDLYLLEEIKTKPKKVEYSWYKI